MHNTLLPHPLYALATLLHIICVRNCMTQATASSSNTGFLDSVWLDDWIPCLIFAISVLFQQCRIFVCSFPFSYLSYFFRHPLFLCSFPTFFFSCISFCLSFLFFIYFYGATTRSRTLAFFKLRLQTCLSGDSIFQFLTFKISRVSSSSALTHLLLRFPTGLVQTVLPSDSFLVCVFHPYAECLSLLFPKLFITIYMCPLQIPFS